MNKDDTNFSWWKQACEKSPNPIAFVSINDKFIFCNKTWCKMIGFSEGELQGKKWQDITKLSDIGPDEREIESIRNGNKEDYYIEKTYIKKDTSTIDVKLYVHKYPDEGSHEGYVVFAERITSQDYEDLKSKFLNLQATVLLLQQSSIASEFMKGQMAILEQKLEQNREITKMIIDRSDRGQHINIGDQTTGDRSGNHAGRDNLIESGKSNTLLLIVVSILITIILLFAGFLTYIKFIN